MKIYIKNLKRTAEIGIYDINGDEATEEWLVKCFSEYSSVFLNLTDNMKKLLNTEADWAINDDEPDCYSRLIDCIAAVQEAIDGVAKIILDNPSQKSNVLSKLNSISSKNYLI